MEMLNKKQKTALKKHSKYQSPKHMQSMKASMEKGATFKKSHNQAMKKVGK